MLLTSVGILASVLFLVDGQQNFTSTTVRFHLPTTQIMATGSDGARQSRSGRFLETDDLEDDNEALDPAPPSARDLSDTNSTSPEGRSFFDDLGISPLGGYKKYEKSYVNLPGYTAGKEKVEGGGLMPSPIPVPGMLNVPFISPLVGGFGGGPGVQPYIAGSPVGYPQVGGFPNGFPPSYGGGYSDVFPPLQTYNVGPSQYLSNGPPAPYGAYPAGGNFYNGPPPPPPPINVAPAVVVRPVVPAPPVGFPVAGNSELGNFISAIRNRPHGPPPNSRPLPSHCTCKMLADCRDVSRFARMYTDDDVAYNGQCLPAYVVCCNPELLEQQNQAAHGPVRVNLPPQQAVLVQPIRTAGSIPAIVPVPVGGPAIVKQVGPGPIPPPPINGGPVCGHKGKNPMARVLDETIQRSETEFGEFPWMVAVLLSDLTYVCGGALVGDRIILTAAHCISKHKNRNLIVRLGEYDVQETDEPPFHDYKVVEAIIHAGYHSGTLRNDVALLVLDVPVKFNAYIAPVCLPEPGISYGPALCTVTGWGKDTMAHGKWSSKLKGVDVPLVTNEYCQNSYRKSPELGAYFNLDSSFVCAGAPGKDACYGDGGSPLVCPINGAYQLVGLVSWGIDCGQYPGVYARVDKFLPWIVDLTKQYS